MTTAPLSFTFPEVQKTIWSSEARQFHIPKDSLTTIESVAFSLTVSWQRKVSAILRSPFFDGVHPIRNKHPATKIAHILAKEILTAFFMSKSFKIVKPK